MANDLDVLLPSGESGVGPVSTFRYGTVTATAPYRVRLDGDSSPLQIAPVNATGWDLGVGARVWCHLYGRSLLMVGVISKGAI